MTKRTTHGYDLTFVMKGVGQDMMKYERRGADRDVSIGEVFSNGPVGIPFPTERVDPESFAVENMNRLFTQRAEAETG